MSSINFDTEQHILVIIAHDSFLTENNQIGSQEFYRFPGTWLKFNYQIRISK